LEKGNNIKGALVKGKVRDLLAIPTNGKKGAYATLN
jgi:hypothetical protein